MNLKVTHITTVHPRNDTRIFVKECKSLSSIADTTLLVADGKGDATVDGVKVIDIGKPKSRLKRLLFFKKLVLRKALELNSDVFHFHDPELIPLGVKLASLGKTVIYDVHEDVPRQILTKAYIPIFFRKILSIAFELYENSMAKKISYIVTATPHIKERFDKIHNQVIAINNFPKLDEMKVDIDWSIKKSQACYIGGITEERGIWELLTASRSTNKYLDLVIAGNFSNQALKERVESSEEWKSVKFQGYLDRQGVRDLLKTSIAGLVTLHPTQNYLESLPVKMFEYMAAGVPVIASNFPLWKSILEKNNAGICVDPLDPAAISAAMIFLKNNPNKAETLARNGQNLVLTMYNWTNEEAKLLSLYKSIPQSL